MWHLGSTLVVERCHGLVVSLFIFTILAFLAVSLRVLARTYIVHSMGVDDYLITLAMTGSVVYLGATMYQIQFGLGAPVPPEGIPNFLKSLYADIVVYNITAILVKFSLLLQFQRIFATSRTKWLFRVFSIWLGVFSIVITGFTIFTCWPIAKYWDDTIPGGCIQRQLLHYIIAGFNILHDFALLAIPWPFLRGLQIAPRAKMVLIGLFACGAFACIVAIIRLYSLHINNSVSIDEQPVYGVDIALWSGLEINTAIICASVPSLKALFKVLPTVSSLSNSSRESSNRFSVGKFVSGNPQILPIKSANEPRDTSTASSNSSPSSLEKGRPDVDANRSFEIISAATAADIMDEDTGSERGLFEEVSKRCL
ncbi:hypothetical protein GQ53DRAFT_839549 [Thozetella sp. PMI_491]|nr:hypothetical protein GQ53DRAFT_839549 [Thozetella sp. PMI_491]